MMDENVTEALINSGFRDQVSNFPRDFVSASTSGRDLSIILSDHRFSNSKSLILYFDIGWRLAPKTTMGASSDLFSPETFDGGTPLSDIPVTDLGGVGPGYAGKLALLGIHSVQDLLFHLPLRYQDRTRILPIGGLRAGDQALVRGVPGPLRRQAGRRFSWVLSLADESGALLLRFFRLSPYQQRMLAEAGELVCFGEARLGAQGPQMIHPELQIATDEGVRRLQTGITAVYPTTQGLSQQQIRSFVGLALARVTDDVRALPEFLPESLLAQYGFSPLTQCIEGVHRPPPDTSVQQLSQRQHPYQRRLAFEELLAHQASLRSMRRKRRDLGAPALRADPRLRDALLRSLPFALTAAQQRVADEVGADLRQPRPALRLVQGDVGSGKTVIGALAALQTVESGYQVAVMAPTELLAEQHLASFRRWLDPLGIDVAWIAGRLPAAERRAALWAVASGEAPIVVGTHALFQAELEFGRLGLVIVDEQHRFGVHQRLALRDKGRPSGTIPHQLVLSATPIPRTLAMTAYADLDLSVIDELPPGRKPVTTAVIADNRRDQVIGRVREACGAGRQAYWVCTAIEESEALQCEAAEATYERLGNALSGLRLGLVHGRLAAAERSAVIDSFRDGDTDLLVATTVIEVGVDVPNASLMVIENSERLGLAQLHQLRGRVGRGAEQSHCVLMYHAPLSTMARQRLAVLRETCDGFRIAQEDLRLRGPGEVLGTRQTGELQFRVADVVRDESLLPEVQRIAEWLLDRHPEVVEPLARRWLGERADYARV